MSAGEHLNGQQFETLYHLTDRARFKPSAAKVPEDNTFAVQQRTRPGLYLTADPERWVNGHGYVRPFVAEVKVPKGVAEHGRWGGERFVPGEHLQQAQVSRVIPLDAHARERWGEHGWIEEHHGTAFDTGESIPRPGAAGWRPGALRGYRYEGPDVREMDKDTVAAHKKRARAFQRSRAKEQGG